MAGQAVTPGPLGQKRKNRKLIGYEVLLHVCLACANDATRERGDELREGDDAGVPYQCYRCGKALQAVDDATQVEV